MSGPKFSAEYKEELATALNTFYDTFAKPRVLPGMDDFKSIVKDVLQRVMTKEPRLKFEPHDVGSVASGDAAVVACDLDILLCLDIEGSVEESFLSPGYAKFKLSEASAKAWGDVASGKYLHPSKITGLFRQHIKYTIAEMNLEKRFSVGGEGSAAVAVKMLCDNYMIKADLVLAVKRTGWPASANADWLQRFRNEPGRPSILKYLPQVEMFGGQNQEWPSTETVSQIKDKGYDLVSTFISEEFFWIGDKGADVELLWRLSMSRAETRLLRSFPETRENEKKCLVILKALRLHDLARHEKPEDRGLKAPVSYILTSYHLKTVFFHEALTNSSSSQRELVDCFLSCLERLYRTHCGNMALFGLPSFFFPKTNLMKHGIQPIRFLNTLRADPLAYFHSILPIDPSIAFSVCYF